MSKKILLIVAGSLGLLTIGFFVMIQATPMEIWESIAPSNLSPTPVFSGRVVDAITQKPLKDVPVELSFYCRDIEGMFTSCANKGKTVLTDADGKYRFGSELNISHRFDGYGIVINASEEGLVYVMNAGGSSVADYSERDGGSAGTVVMPNGYYSYSRSFSHQASGNVDFSTELIPRVSTIENCVRMSSRALTMRCANILAYQAAERIWTHADDLPHSSISSYFESYFLQQYERLLFGTCQDRIPGFCRSLEAIDRNDASICEKETGRAREECYFAVAVQLNQPDLCQQAPDRIPEMDERNNYGEHLSKLKCLQYTALKNEDRGVCDRLQINPPVDWQGYTISRGQCIREVAITARDASICLADPNAKEEGPYRNGTMLEHCIGQVGYRTKDDRACDGLQLPDLKKRCLDGVQSALHPVFLGDEY